MNTADVTGVFEEYRKLLFSIAYRMLGSVMEEVVNGRIASFWAVLNPDKLTSLPGPQA